MVILFGTKSPTPDTPPITNPAKYQQPLPTQNGSELMALPFSEHNGNCPDPPPTGSCLKQNLTRQGGHSASPPIPQHEGGTPDHRPSSNSHPPKLMNPAPQHQHHHYHPEAQLSNGAAPLNLEASVLAPKPRYDHKGHHNQPVTNPNHNLTNARVKDEYTLSPETYDLDFPPSLGPATTTSPTGPRSLQTGNGTDNDSSTSSHVSSNKSTEGGARTRAESPVDVGDISDQPAGPIKNGETENPTDSTIATNLGSKGQERSTPPPKLESSPPTTGAIDPDTPNNPTSPATATETALTNNGDKYDTGPAGKTGFGPRKKGNKAKWVPIEINRAPFRDEFFSNTYNNQQGSNNAAPPKNNFLPKRENNGPPPGFTGSASGPVRRRLGNEQPPMSAAPNQHNPANRTTPFRRQNSQYSMQSRDSPTPTRPFSSDHDCPSSAPKGHRRQFSPASATTDTPVPSQTPAPNFNHDFDRRQSPQEPRASGLVQADHAKIPVPPGNTFGPNHHPPSPRSSSSTHNNDGGQGNYNPPRAAQYNPYNSTRTPVPGINGENQAVKNLANGYPVQTVPRRASYNPNRSSGSLRLSQPTLDGPGPAYNANVPLFTGIPGLSRLHLNAPPVPTYITGGPAHHAAYQVPLMAPYPYDNEAYYNYNTVLAHPFFAPQLYYRSIATAGLPAPATSLGLGSQGNNPALLGLSPAAAASVSLSTLQPGPNQRWHSSSSHTYHGPSTVNPATSGSSWKTAPASVVATNHGRSADSVAAVPPEGPKPNGGPQCDNCDTATTPGLVNDHHEAKPDRADPSPNPDEPPSDLLSQATPKPVVKPQPQQHTLRSKSETSVQPMSDEHPPLPVNLNVVNTTLPSLMSALPPRILAAPPLLGPPFYAQHHPHSPLGSLSPPNMVPPILVGAEGGPTPGIIVLTGGHTVSPQFNVPLIDQMRKQIEYYFSEENLQKDLFLRRNMDRHGFIPLSLIVSFHRVKMLTSDINLIRQAIKSSSEVEFVSDRVRTKHNPTLWPISYQPDPTGLTPYQAPPHSSLDDDFRASDATVSQADRHDLSVSTNTGPSNFPFPPMSSDPKHVTVDDIPTPHRRHVTLSPHRLDQDDEKLLNMLANCQTGRPVKPSHAFSPRYFCHYFLRKSYSLPSLVSSPNATRLMRRRRPTVTLAESNVRLSDCVVALPTDQLIKVLRMDSTCKFFAPWKYLGECSLTKVASRLTQALDITFDSLNDDERIRLLPHASTKIGEPPARTTTLNSQGGRVFPRSRSNSFPTVRSYLSSTPATLCRLKPSAWCLRSDVVISSLATQTPLLDDRATPNLTHRTQFDRPQASNVGRNPALHAMLNLLKDKHWLTLTPYTTLIRRYQQRQQSQTTTAATAHDDPTQSDLLQSLYAFWSNYLITTGTAHYHPQNASLLNHPFRDTLFQNSDSHPSYEFGIERLLEVYRHYLLSPHLADALLTKDRLVSTLLVDLAQIVKNGKFIHAQNN